MKKVRVNTGILAHGILILLLLPVFANCRGKGVFNPANPASPEYHLQNLLSCLLESSVCSTNPTGGAALAPQITPGTGTYVLSVSVTISSATAGALLLYTEDGTPVQHDGSGNPAGTTLLYSSPLAFSNNTTLQAAAFKPGLEISSTATADYTIVLGTVATPVFSPGTGTYAAAQNVTITTTTTGATIFFTTDGTDPTHDGLGNPTGTTAVYSGPLNVSATTTVKAVGFKTDYLDSTRAAAIFTIDLQPPTTSNFGLSTLSWSKITTTANISENGTGYCVAVLNGGPPPTTLQIVAGSGGAIVGIGGSVALSGNVDGNCVVSGLTANIIYDIYFVPVDTVSNMGAMNSTLGHQTTTHNYRSYQTGLYNGALGGVVGADARCNAGAKPTTAVYKALIVDGANRVASVSPNTGDGQVDWVFRPGQNYFRSDGITPVMTTDAAGLFIGTLTNPFTASPTGRSNWMGLNADWTTSVNLCSNWASSLATDNGSVGYSINTTTAAFSWGLQPCDGNGTHTMGLMCIEQYE